MQHRLFVSSIVICTGHWSRIWYSLQVSHSFYISTYIPHYSDVITCSMASQLTSLTFVCLTVYQAQIKENIKVPRHWPLCGQFTGNRWIPRTKGQQRGKMFPLYDVIMEQPIFPIHLFTTRYPCPLFDTKLLNGICIRQYRAEKKSDEHIPIEEEINSIAFHVCLDISTCLFECLARYTKPPESCILCPYQIFTKPVERNKADIYTCMQRTPVWFKG